jgi:hypothetical protein
MVEAMNRSVKFWKKSSCEFADQIPENAYSIGVPQSRTFGGKPHTEKSGMAPLAHGTHQTEDNRAQVHA